MDTTGDFSLIIRVSGNMYCLLLFKSDSIWALWVNGLQVSCDAYHSLQREKPWELEEPALSRVLEDKIQSNIEGSSPSYNHRRYRKCLCTRSASGMHCGLRLDPYCALWISKFSHLPCEQCRGNSGWRYRSLGREHHTQGTPAVSASTSF